MVEEAGGHQTKNGMVVEEGVGVETREHKPHALEEGVAAARSSRQEACTQQDEGVGEVQHPEQGLAGRKTGAVVRAREVPGVQHELAHDWGAQAAHSLLEEAPGQHATGAKGEGEEERDAKLEEVVEEASPWASSQATLRPTDCLKKGAAGALPTMEQRERDSQEELAWQQGLHETEQIGKQTRRCSGSHPG